MANTTIKISQLPSIGNGLSVTTILPVVDTNGTATTNKVSVGNIANFTLTQAGNTLPPAFVSQIAYSVANAAQPNITSVGTLSVNTLKISGGTNGYILQTDGAGNLAWVAGGGSGNGVVGGANTQIQFNNAGNFGGDTDLTWDAGNNKLITANFAATTANISSNVNTVNLNATGNVRPNAIYTDNYYYANGYVFGGGGGNGVPGGSNTQIQFNDNGVFGGNANLTFNKVSRVLSSPFLAGNGNGLSNIQGANISGFVPNANVANTAFAVAGANVSGEVSFAGTANSVAVANVVGLGNIATVALNGNGSQVLLGNGTWGNTSGGTSSELVNGDNSFVLDGDGNVVFEGTPSGNAVNRGLVWDYGANANGVNSQIRQDGAGLTVRAYTTDGGGANGYSATVNIVTNQDATEKQWVFDGDGNLTLPGNLRMSSGNIVSGDIAPTFNSAITGITTGNATVIVTLVDGPFDGPFQGQVTISGVTGTTEANDTWYYEAVEENAFELFTDDTFTTPVDGTSWTTYISGGNAVSTGTYENLTIQGGNVSIGSNDKIWTFDTTGNLTLPGNTFAVNYANGTQVSIGGGSGNTGNVTFDDNIVIGTGDEFGSTGLFLAPGNGSIANSAVQYLRVRGGDAPTHIHLDTGNNQFYDQYFGDDAKYVKLELGDAGNVVIGTDDANGNQYNWSFTSDGNLILADGNSIITSIANSSLDPLNPNVSTMVFTPDQNYTSQSLVIDPTGPSHIHLRAPGANIDEPSANIFLGGEASSFEVGYYNGAAPNVYIHSGGNTWTFDTIGSLNLPTIELDVGNTINEQTIIQSQRKIIPPFRYSVEIDGSTPTLVYSATDNSITSMKVAIQIQHTGLGFEFFDVSATSSGSDTYYTVSNRLHPPGITDSTVVVDLDDSNAMEITVTINSGAANSWVTYDATEFGIAVD